MWRMYEWCFIPRFCKLKAMLGSEQPGLMRLICYESCPWCRIDGSTCTCWPAVHRATTVLRMPPNMWRMIQVIAYICVYTLISQLSKVQYIDNRKDASHRRNERPRNHVIVILHTIGEYCSNHVNGIRVILPWYFRGGVGSWDRGTLVARWTAGQQPSDGS